MFKKYAVALCSIALLSTTAFAGNIPVVSVAASAVSIAIPPAGAPGSGGASQAPVSPAVQGFLNAASSGAPVEITGSPQAIANVRAAALRLPPGNPLREAVLAATEES